MNAVAPYRHLRRGMELVFFNGHPLIYDGTEAVAIDAKRARGSLPAWRQSGLAENRASDEDHRRRERCRTRLGLIGGEPRSDALPDPAIARIGIDGHEIDCAVVSDLADDGAAFRLASPFRAVAY